VSATVLVLLLQASFRPQTIETDSGGIGYNSCLADVDGDGRLDIVLVTEKADQVLWYQNPTWKRRLITKEIPSPEPLTPFDVDGDGKLELVVGGDWSLNDTRGGGTLWLLRRPDDLDRPWTPVKIDQEPSLHRLAVMEVDGKPTLVASCLMGRGTKAPDWTGAGSPLYLLRPSGDPFRDPWTRETISNDLHIVHGIWPRGASLYVAAHEGVFEFTRADGKWLGRRRTTQGAGEVRLIRDRREEAILTVEPWHGDKVVLHHGGHRRILLEGYTVGHGLVPFDDDRRVLAGFRGEKGRGHAVVLLHREGDGFGNWRTEVLDASDLEADGVHAADLDGDGDTDLVVTGKGSNIRIFWNLEK
jgi:hypothetical protein